MWACFSGKSRNFESSSRPTTTPPGEGEREREREREILYNGSIVLYFLTFSLTLPFFFTFTLFHLFGAGSSWPERRKRKGRNGSDVKFCGETDKLKILSDV